MAELAYYLLTFVARTERAKRGIDGNLWSRGTATMSYPCDACEEGLPCSVDVLPGRASAIQATRGDGIGRLGGASSEQLWQGSQHSRSACSSRHVPGPTGRQDNKDGSRLLELFHFSEHVFQRLWSEHDVFQCATCDGASTLQNGNGTAGFALLAGDEGEPLCPGSPVGRKRRCAQFKREPTHRGGIVRRLVLGNREIHSGC